MKDRLLYKVAAVLCRVQEMPIQEWHTKKGPEIIAWSDRPGYPSMMVSQFSIYRLTPGAPLTLKQAKHIDAEGLVVNLEWRDSGWMPDLKTLGDFPTEKGWKYRVPEAT